VAELKTKPNKNSPHKFINSLDNPVKKADAKKLLKIFQEVTKEKPIMWGQSIIGFGKYHYKSTRSKQEGDWPLTGFSPRKQSISLYIMSGFKENKDLLKKLGKHKTSVGCLYVKKLSDIDVSVLKRIIKKSVADMKKRHQKKKPKKK